MMIVFQDPNIYNPPATSVGQHVFFCSCVAHRYDTNLHPVAHNSVTTRTCEKRCVIVDQAASISTSCKLPHSTTRFRCYGAATTLTRQQADCCCCCFGGGQRKFIDWAPKLAGLHGVTGHHNIKGMATRSTTIIFVAALLL